MVSSRSLRITFFWPAMCSLGLLYVLSIVAMLWADIHYLSLQVFLSQLGKPTVRYALQLSLLSSGISALISLWIAVPTAYVLNRWGQTSDELTSFYQRRIRLLRWIVDGLLDIPIVLPPLVIGISLLVLFQMPIGQSINAMVRQAGSWLGIDVDGVTFEVPAIIVAQTMVVTAYSIQMLRQVCNHIPMRHEEIAITLGASRWQTFASVIFPQLKPGLVATGTMAFAKSLGEFGPILVFAGMTPWKTEILPTSIYLNFQKGDLSAALSLSMLMILISLVLVLGLRLTGRYVDGLRVKGLNR